MFFISARVHPGETPSSFVFNGFLDFILRNEDPRAAALRNRYVFKMIPMLNPDGVKRGHYRTDPRGVNLNRVYLHPDPLLHPSIFAAKSIILYHHHKGGLPEPGYGCTCDAHKGGIEEDSIIANVENSLMTPQNSVSECQVCTVGQEKQYNSRESTCEELKQRPPDPESVEMELKNNIKSNLAKEKDHKGNNTDTAKVCNNLQSLVLENECLPPLEQSNPLILNGKELELSVNNDISSESKSSMSNADCTEKQSVDTLSNQVLKATESNSNRREPQKCTCVFKPSGEASSGVTFYVDLHGHASKRGCFVYANFLENEDDYVNTILFPKLISLNSANFDFTASNFTEKNMYSKDKQDGTSKEGSGRVAIHKATGMVHR